MEPLSDLLMYLDLGTVRPERTRERIITPLKGIIVLRTLGYTLGKLEICLITEAGHSLARSVLKGKLTRKGDLPSMCHVKSEEFTLPTLRVAQGLSSLHVS